MVLKILKKYILALRFLLVLDRLKLGNFGDCKSVGYGLAELRIHWIWDKNLLLKGRE